MNTQKKVVNSDWFDVGKTDLGNQFCECLNVVVSPARSRRCWMA